MEDTPLNNNNTQEHVLKLIQFNVNNLIKYFYKTNNISFEKPSSVSILYRKTSDGELEHSAQRNIDRKLDDYLYDFEYNSDKYVDYLVKEEEGYCYYYLKLDLLYCENIDTCYVEVVYPYVNVADINLTITSSVRISKQDKQKREELLDELWDQIDKDREIEILREIHNMDRYRIAREAIKETYKDFDINMFKKHIIVELLNEIGSFWKISWNKVYDKFKNPQYVFTSLEPHKDAMTNTLEKGINTFLMDIHQEISLDIINEISNLKYEKANIKGEIVFPTALVKDIINNSNRVINLASLVSFKETRKIRKLLEMTSEKYRLIALDESKSYGMHNFEMHDFDAYVLSIGTIKESYLDACFIIKFNGPLEWELYRGNKFILSSSNYKISLRMNNPDVKSYLKDEFYSIFNKNNSNFERVWEVVQAAAQQSKGTMLVVSNKAQEESCRLRDMSFNVKPFRLTKNFVKIVSSIDGSIMIDPKGVCYALGVILDGTLVENNAADSSRGARYNSAIKYRDLMKNDSRARFMIVVVSEDGMVDVIK